jgi:hypothetical protein
LPVYFPALILRQFGPDALVPSEGLGRQWVAAWQLVREAVGIRLAAMEPAEDLSAYRPANQFINEEFPNFKAVSKALADNPAIRTRRPASKKTGKPIPNRLDLHTTDWHDFLQRRKHAAPDRLDLPAGAVDTMVQEIEQRKREEREPRSAE